MSFGNVDRIRSSLLFFSMKRGIETQNKQEKDVQTVQYF